MSSLSESCPLCASVVPLEHEIEICGGCHAGLHLSGAVRVETTGEFQAISAEGILNPAFDTGRRASSSEETSCCWCSKASGDVKKLLSQGDYHICNECVALCADILRMELGDDFS